ncbi:MAG: Rne/Rng family ribonuclease [Syntrophales bacterium]|nr:Rne/Rng family ribonuclease [Syntrophales bacterium]
MKKEMLINAVHSEQKRMAIVDEGKLVEYNIQMAIREPITGNIYKGIVMKVERGLQAAFVNYGGKKDGFLPLRDVSQEYFTERRETGGGGGASHPRSSLKVGQEVLVQVLREVGERKGALLTTYISLPGRYLVLMPKKAGGGISRKIEDEGDRKRLKEMMTQIKVEEGMGFIIRTAGMNRTKQELSRDYQQLSRLWKEIQKRANASAPPALIYQESDFGVCSLRDYFTSEIEEIWVDDLETFRMMRAYCKTVMPRNVKIIKQYKDKTPMFEKYGLEDQVRVIYQERVDLKSGGYLIINPTEAMITIDVNSGRGSNKRNVEETAFRTNIEAAEEIARQLRLRDLGGLIVIDFIDMIDRQHNAEVEKVFKKALSVDRARIQLSRISKFGMLELSRQKKQSTIQEISYTACPYCKGTGFRPALEYIALSAFRKIESKAVRGRFSHLKVTLPYAVADYLLNQKRVELSKIETTYDMTIHISGEPNMTWDDVNIVSTERPLLPEHPVEPEIDEVSPADVSVDTESETLPSQTVAETVAPPEPKAVGGGEAAQKKKPRRRSRHRKKKPQDANLDGQSAPQPAETVESAAPETSNRGGGRKKIVKPVVAVPQAPADSNAGQPVSPAERTKVKEDLLNKLLAAFEDTEEITE